MLKFYEYDKCSTCRNARKWLDEKGIDYERIAIRETPPSPRELQIALNRYEGNLKRLVNTSSADYRASGLKDEIDSLEPEAVFERIQQNGNLAKRPFLISEQVCLVGFKPDEWDSAFAE